MQSYKESNVRKKSADFPLYVYNITKSGFKDELFGIVSQMRPAAVFLLSNSEEGHVSNASKKIPHFPYIVLSSLLRLDSQTIASYRVDFADDNSQQRVC